jgi:hypothetical protein
MAPRAHRDNVQDQLRTLIREARDVAGGLDRAAFNRPPAPGSWSVGQCLEHLNDTARLYLPLFAEHIEAARSRGLTAEPGAGDRTLIGRVVTWMMEPPPRFRMKTFDVIRPGEQALDPTTVLRDFETLHEEVIVRANESADLDRRKIRIPSALMPRLVLSLGDWFVFVAAHGRRHLHQARTVRSSLGLHRDPSAPA